MNTKGITNALLEVTFLEKFNINNFCDLKKKVFKNGIQHKFVVIDSNGNEQQNQTLQKQNMKRNSNKG